LISKPDDKPYLHRWLHFPQSQHHRYTQSYQRCYCR